MQAAYDLVNEVEKAILQRLDNPLSFEQFFSSKDREHPYYRIYVKNYIIYYVVVGEWMEVRAIVFNRRLNDVAATKVT